MVTLQDGAVLSYQTDIPMDIVTSFVTDWRERLVVSYQDGGIVFYDLNDKKPVARIQRPSSNYKMHHTITKTMVDNITFDGAYLLTPERNNIVAETELYLGLHDFLQLKLKD